MFGKLSSLISYWKVLEVYVCKRFPSNKLPMFGMTFTYLALFIAAFKSVRTNQFLGNMPERREDSWNFSNHH